MDNDIELCIRPLKVGLNSYGYSHNHDAAYRAAMMYSFIATCNKADVNPREWMIDILPKLKVCGNDYDRLAKLLPGEWKKTHPESRSMVHHTTEEEHVKDILKSRAKKKKQHLCQTLPSQLTQQKNRLTQPNFTKLCYTQPSMRFKD